MAITAVSSVALGLLRGAGVPLAVHSRFRSGVNLACGGFLAFAGPGAASGACGIEVTAEDAALLATGDAWLWQGDGLHAVGSRAAASRGAGAALGDPARGGRRAAVPLASDVRVYAPRVPRLHRLAEGAADVVEAARRAAGGVSWFDDGDGLTLGLPRLRAALATLFAAECPSGEGLTAAHPDDEGLVEHAGGGGLAGPAAGPSRTERSLRAALLRIVGLGVGLTPSGDDAVIGALCVMAALGFLGAAERGAARAGAAAPERGAATGAGVFEPGLTRDAAPERDSLSRSIERVLVDEAGGQRTTDVSASYLRLAVSGAFSPSLAAVVALLGRPHTRRPAALGRPDPLRAAVTAELRYGATSGADSLVGVREACALLLAQPQPERVS
ncbi:MAG TPA: DUF2877 domain-containing protein [Microbacteriaceae bacterium]|nr:DUF2877 domain-containing protein [Microbacteriaceae bacterium]